MTPVVWGMISAIIIPLSYLTWNLAVSDRTGIAAIRTNLMAGIGGQGASGAAASSLVSDVARKLTPTAYIAKLDRLLALAGRPRSMPLEKLLVLKPVLALAGAAVAILIMNSAPSLRSMLIGFFSTLFAYFLPDLLIKNTGTKRQQAIEMELPDTLDQMLISVEAGLGFEAAMARAGQNGKGPLAEELVRTLQDIQVGRPRREAYQSFGERCSVQDVRSFVRAVIQADKYGIGIATVLKSQAKQARVRRKQRAEEKAMKLPVKTLFPLVLFIFPVMFIVMLGPAAINVMKSFG